MLFAGSLCGGARRQDHRWLPVRPPGLLGSVQSDEAGQEGAEHEAQPAGGLRAQCGRLKHPC